MEDHVVWYRFGARKKKGRTKGNPTTNERGSNQGSPPRRCQHELLCGSSGGGGVQYQYRTASDMKSCGRVTHVAADTCRHSHR